MLGKPPAPVWRRVRRRRLQHTSISAPGRPSSRPDGRQTATGAQITVLPDANFGEIYRVTRANFNAGRTTPGLHQLLRAGHLARREPADDQPGAAIRAGEPLGGTIVKDFTLKNNWAPASARRSTSTGDGRTKIFGSYGRFFARMPNDLAARVTVGRRRDQPRRLLRRRSDAADPERSRDDRPGERPDITNHFVLTCVGADTIDPNAKLSYMNECRGGRRARDPAAVPPSASATPYRNIGRVLEDVANAPMVAYDLGVPGLSASNTS